MPIHKSMLVFSKNLTNFDPSKKTLHNQSDTILACAYVDFLKDVSTMYSSVKQTECMHMCRSSTDLELRHYVSMFLNLVKIGNSVSFVISLSPAYIWLEPTETIKFIIRQFPWNQLNLKSQQLRILWPLFLKVIKIVVRK